MEHDIPFGNSNRENGTTFLDFPLFLGIFQWDEPTKRVPFTAEPEIPEILTKWKAPIDTFYFPKNFYKNNTKLSKKKGWLRPPRPTPKLNNSLLKIGDSNKLDIVPITGSGRNSFSEETTMRSKKRESSISLGVFTC